MANNLLGVFCPFWSNEGPHFVLPHFQGMMKTLGADASVLDLNIEAGSWRTGATHQPIHEDRLRRIELHLADLGFKNARSIDAEDPRRRALKRVGICAV